MQTLTVFEYSRDLHVKRTLDKIVKDPLPFKNICQLIRQYHFESLLAPCISARDATVNFNKGKDFIETSYSDVLASVVQSGEINDTTNYINTLWSAPITPLSLEALYCCKLI